MSRVWWAWAGIVIVLLSVGSTVTPASEHALHPSRKLASRSHLPSERSRSPENVLSIERQRSRSTSPAPSHARPQRSIQDLSLDTRRVIARKLYLGRIADAHWQRNRQVLTTHTLGTEDDRARDPELRAMLGFEDQSASRRAASGLSPFPTVLLLQVVFPSLGIAPPRVTPND